MSGYGSEWCSRGWNEIMGDGKTFLKQKQTGLGNCSAVDTEMDTKMPPNLQSQVSERIHVT